MDRLGDEPSVSCHGIEKTSLITHSRYFVIWPNTRWGCQVKNKGCVPCSGYISLGKPKQTHLFCSFLPLFKVYRCMKNIFRGRVRNSQAFVSGAAKRAEWPQPYAFPWHQVERGMLCRSRKPRAASAGGSCHVLERPTVHTKTSTSPVTTKPS